MPRKFKNKNKTFRRRLLNKRNNNSKTMWSRIGGSPLSREMPPRYRMIIETGELLQATFPGPSVEQTIVISPCDMNAIFNGISTARSPYYDSMIGKFYNRFVVLKSSIILELFHSTTSTATGVWCAVVPSFDTSALTLGVLDAQVNRKCTHVMIGSVTGINKARLLNRSTSLNMFGVSPLNDLDYSGTNGTGPVQQWYWSINFTADNLGAVVRINCRIINEVLFFDRRQLPLTIESIVAKSPDLVFKAPLTTETVDFKKDV